MKQFPSDLSKTRATLFSLGAISAFAQLLLLREVLFLVGGTELAASVVLAAWLLAAAAGAYAPSRIRAGRSPAEMLAACAVLLPVQVFILRVVRGVMAGSSGVTPPAFWLLAIFALVLSPMPGILGAVFALGAEKLGRSGGARAYSLEMAGLVTGALLSVALAALQMEYLAVALVSSLIVLSVIPVLSRSRAAVLVAFLPLIIALAGPWRDLERFSTAFAFRLPHVDSIISTPRGRAFSTTRGTAVHVYSGGFARKPLAAANEVVEIVLSAATDSTRILLVCEDPEGYARSLGTFRGSRAVVLTPDPWMLEFRRAVRPFGLRENVDVVAEEPLEYLRRGNAPLDVMVITAGAPLTAQNNRLFTHSFFVLARSRMAGSGVIAVELPFSRGHVPAELAAMAGSIWKTLGEVFNTRRVALTHYSGSLIILASNDTALGVRNPGLAENRDLQREKLGLFEPVDLEQAYFSTGTVSAREILESGKWPVNTVTSPACYQHAISHSQRRYGPPGVLAWAWELNILHWAGAAIVLALLFFIAAVLLRREYGSMSPAFGGGLCAMVAEIMVIYIFQSSHGLVYSHLGILAGSFMLGAVAGAVWNRRRSSAFAAFAILALLAGYTGALPYLLGVFTSSSHFAVRYLIFPAASGVAGLLAGALFPVVSNLAPDRAAGRIYAADLAGASAGALLAGLVLIPSLGLHQAAFTAGLAGVLLAFPLLPVIIARASGR